MNLKCCGLSFLSKSSSESDIKDDLHMLKLEKNKSDNNFKNFMNLAESYSNQNQKLEKAFSLNTFKNETALVKSFRDVDTREKQRCDFILRKNQTKDQNDGLSIKSFSDIELREKQRVNALLEKNTHTKLTEEISISSFNEIEKRERKRKESKKHYIYDTFPFSFDGGTENKEERHDRISINSFSEIDSRETARNNLILKENLQKRLSDEMSIKSFSEIEARELERAEKILNQNQKRSDSFVSFDKLKNENRKTNGGSSRLETFFKRLSLNKDQLSINSFGEIEEREKQRRRLEMIKKKESFVNEQQSEVFVNSFKDVEARERERRDVSLKEVEPPEEISVLSFVDEDMKEKRRGDLLLNRNDNISFKSFSDHDAEVNQKSFLIERADRRSNTVLEKKSADTVTDNKSLISSKFGPKDLKYFLSQDINAIRAKKKKFEDRSFLKTLSSIVENRDSQLFMSLKSRLNASKPSDLMQLIKWKKIEV